MTADRLERFVKLATQGIWTVDANNLTDFVNDYGASIIGYKPEEMLGRPVTDFIYPESKEAAEGQLRDRREGKGQQDQFRLCHKDGHDVWISFNASPMYDEKGNYEGAISIFSDVTEQRHVRVELMESREDLSLAQTVSKTGNWRLRVKTNELLWSDETYRMFGIPTGTPMTYELFLSKVHPDDRKHVDERWQAALRGEGYDIEHRIVVNGEVRWVREKAFLEFEAGTLCGGFGIVQDITENKQLECALRQNEEKLRLKLDSLLSPDVDIEDQDLRAIVDTARLQSLMDDHYRQTRMAMSLIDLKGEVLVGTGWQDMCTRFHRVNPETQRNCIDSDTALSRELKPGEIVSYKCRNGLNDVVTPLFIGDKHVANLFTGQFFYADEVVDESRFSEMADRYGFDKESYLEALRRVPRWTREQVDAHMRFLVNLSSFISNLSSRNIALAKAQQELVRSNEELRQYTYVASHDLQEPLRMVSSYVGLLDRRYGDSLDGRAREYMAFAVEGSIRARELVSDLLEYTRMDGADTPSGPVDMNKVVTETLNDLEMPIKDAQATVEVGDLPTITANEHQMRLVMQNLVSNAVKFRGRDPPLVSISAVQCGREWVFSVEDNGIGIDPAYFDKIFQVFQRLHGREEYPGTGIGLAIVKKIIERHSGRIWVESQEGQGATFYFSVPRK